MRVFSKKIVGSGVAEHLGEEALAAHGIPSAAPHLAAHHHGALLRSTRQLPQLQVALLDGGETLKGARLQSAEHAHELYPLGLPKGRCLVVAEMGHQGNACFCKSVVTATLRGRHKNGVGLHGYDGLRVELPFYAYAQRLSIIEALLHILIEKMPRAGNAADAVQSVETDEVAQLQRGHAHEAPDGRGDGNISVGNGNSICLAGHQGDMVGRGTLVLRVLDIHQPHPVIPVRDAEPFCIAGLQGNGGVGSERVGCWLATTVVGSGTTCRQRKDDKEQNEEPHN